MCKLPLKYQKLVVRYPLQPLIKGGKLTQPFYCGIVQINCYKRFVVSHLMMYWSMSDVLEYE